MASRRQNVLGPPMTIGLFNQDPSDEEDRKPSGWYVRLVQLAGIAGVGLVELVRHGPSIDHRLAEPMYWPRLIMSVLGTCFFVSLLPEAWNQRRDDKGGLFFVVVLNSIGIFAIWAQLTGWADYKSPGK